MPLTMKQRVKKRFRMRENMKEVTPNLPENRPLSALAREVKLHDKQKAKRCYEGS